MWVEIRPGRFLIHRVCRFPFGPLLNVLQTYVRTATHRRQVDRQIGVRDRQDLLACQPHRREKYLTVICTHISTCGLWVRSCGVVVGYTRKGWWMEHVCGSNNLGVWRRWAVVTVLVCFLKITPVRCPSLICPHVLDIFQHVGEIAKMR